MVKTKESIWPKDLGIEKLTIDNFRFAIESLARNSRQSIGPLPNTSAEPAPRPEAERKFEK